MGLHLWTHTNLMCNCGGEIEIKDWALIDPDYDPNFLFEASCSQCLQCDPNGYRDMLSACKGAVEYFKDA